MKNCKDCGIDKELEDFYKQPYNKDGRQSFCKVCSKIRVKKWYDSKRDLNKVKTNKRVTQSGIKLGNNKNAKWRRYLKDNCRRCGFIPEDICQLTVDHIDRDKRNNSLENLQTLCCNCHNLKTKIELIEPEKLLLLNLIPGTS